MDYASLRGNVSLLGRMLGDTIAAAQGEEFLQLIEQIRSLSKRAREGSAGARDELKALLLNLGSEELVPVARAFSQFLNLANIADQHHNVSREADELLSASRSLASDLGELIEQGVPAEQVIDAVRTLRIELVLTAHPTEITRRTLIHKHAEVGRCLSQLELAGLTERERARLHLRLRELIAQIWFGDD
ncbi:MAG: phosphoenolpyruvate carboxylase, partial [Ottowia sp.]|nr:phosphoenolpyruvate carboxylase [Ottowia sp.]